MIGDYRYEYTSPRGVKVIFDPSATEGPYMLMPTPKGAMSNGLTGGTRKAPGQRGSSAVEVYTAERLMSIQAVVLAVTEDEYWDRRETLAEALIVDPPAVGERPKLGILRLLRPGREPLELEVLPEDSPLEGGRPDRLSLIADIEFRAFSPFWRGVNLSSVSLVATDGGFTLATEFPLESTANDVEQTVDNPGTVPSHIEANIYGECTNPRIMNVTYDERIQYVGSLLAGESLYVTTEFGNKRAIKTDAAGVETNAMANIDLSVTTFWQVRPGDNLIRFEADANPSGRASIQFRPRYSGI